MTTAMPWPAWVALWMAATSSVTFAMYGWDKRAAVGGRRRISEKNLLLGSLLGGWPGAMLAASVFRHKTVKTSYRVKLVIVTLINVLLLAGTAYLIIRSPG